MFYSRTHTFLMPCAWYKVRQAQCVMSGLCLTVPCLHTWCPRAATALSCQVDRKPSTDATLQLRAQLTSTLPCQSVRRSAFRARAAAGNATSTAPSKARPKASVEADVKSTVAGKDRDASVRGVDARKGRPTRGMSRTSPSAPRRPGTRGDPHTKST